MVEPPTYEELEKRVAGLEQQVDHYKTAELQSPERADKPITNKLLTSMKSWCKLLTRKQLLFSCKN